MSAKVIYLSKSVYQLCKDNPELPEILVQIGFEDIIKPGLLTTVGRYMTIPKGANAKKIDINKIKKTLIDSGYEIEE